MSVENMSSASSFIRFTLALLLIACCKQQIFIQDMNSNYEEYLKKANNAIEKLIILYNEAKILKIIIKLQDSYNAKLESYIKKLENWTSYLEEAKKKSSS